ncbi:hypothetical protein PABG_12367 [Paracoccidioides brasiliensis Pb03]|nr:hypothetical protein PABG_12367 [Paracoccidioides brasiliensis Pb03]
MGQKKKIKQGKEHEAHVEGGINQLSKLTEDEVRHKSRTNLRGRRVCGDMQRQGLLFRPVGFSPLMTIEPHRLYLETPRLKEISEETTKEMAIQNMGSRECSSPASRKLNFSPSAHNQLGSLRKALQVIPM